MLTAGCIAEASRRPAIATITIRNGANLFMIEVPAWWARENEIRKGHVFAWSPSRAEAFDAGDKAVQHVLDIYHGVTRE